MCDSCGKFWCGVAFFVPAILCNLFVLLFPITGIIMIIEGDYAAGLITVIIGSIFFLGSLIKTIFPLTRVFCGVDMEEKFCQCCFDHMTCCSGLCFQEVLSGSQQMPNQTETNIPVSNIQFADGSGRIFTISTPNHRSSTRISDISLMPLPPPKKSQDSIAGECVICYDSHRKIALIPCGHVVCEECVRKMTKWECHICRQNITSLLRLYYGRESENTLHQTDEIENRRQTSASTSVTIECATAQNTVSRDSISIEMEDLSGTNPKPQTCTGCDSLEQHSAVLYPCGHVMICYTCALKLDRKKCPECKIRIKSINEVYM